VPREVLYRPKRGFDVPISDWLRGEWREFARDTLSASALRRSGALRHDAVASVIAHHEANPGFAASHMVFTLLCFQMWHDANHSPGRG
jgi:asparagine synthase (glutamine-hydrolysing)